jgi:hypothetical protein
MRKKPARIRLIDDTGFLVQRVKPHEDKLDETIDSQEHRSWVSSLPCHACGRKDGVQAAHLRKGAGHPKAGDKKDDFWCWPGCFQCHEQIQHMIGEDSFWEKRLGDPDRWRTVLMRYGRRSPVSKVRMGADVEWKRRYGAAA